MASTKIKDKPYIENYPPLKDWLDKREALCNWQLPVGGTKNKPNGYVESWYVPGGGEVIVFVRADGHGWNIYTPCRSNEVAATLADADERLKPRST